jgi:hypothetical protein
MGPAFAGSVVLKAIADRAITEAIAVIEIIFMSRSPWTSMPTLSTWRFTIEKAIIKKVIFAHPPGLTARRLRAVSDFSKRARTATRRMKSCLMEIGISPSIPGWSACNTLAPISAE